VHAIEEWKAEDARKDQAREDLIYKLTKDKKTLSDRNARLEEYLKKKDNKNTKPHSKVTKFTKKLEESSEKVETVRRKLSNG
jgi:septal ring factor EnvC (AmiA/AmiB activator)